MPAWVQSDKNRNQPAFLTALPIQRHFREPFTPNSCAESRVRTESPLLLRRRTASLPSLQKCNHMAPTACMVDLNCVEVILLVDHGSRRAVANDMLSSVGSMLQERTHLSVYTAHMELANPTIAEGVDTCVKEGATHVIVVPFFLSPGRHSTTDIPQMTADAVANYPGVTYDVRPPIGTHPGIIDVILDRAGLLGSVQN